MTQPTTPAPGGESLASIHGYLLHLAKRHLGGDLYAKEGANDLVQSALLSAHEHRDQYRGTSDAQFKGWLRQILYNTARKYRRLWRAESRLASRELSLDADPTLRLGPVSRETPSLVLLRKELRRQLIEAMIRLPREQRQAVVGRVLEGLTFDEIGESLGRSADAARMLFRRALIQLRQWLPADAAEGWGIE